MRRPRKPKPLSRRKAQPEWVKWKRWYRTIDLRPTHDEQGFSDPAKVMRLVNRAISELGRKHEYPKHGGLWGTRIAYLVEKETNEFGWPIWEREPSYRNEPLNTLPEIQAAIKLNAYHAVTPRESSKRRSLLSVTVYVYPDVNPFAKANPNDGSGNQRMAGKTRTQGKRNKGPRKGPKTPKP